MKIEMPNTNIVRIYLGRQPATGEIRPGPSYQTHQPAVKQANNCLKKNGFLDVYLNIFLLR